MPRFASIHYLSPKVVGRERPGAGGGHGVFAVAPIAKGDLVSIWGGEIVNARDLEQVPEPTKSHSVQVEEDAFIVPHGEPEHGDWFNHSCEPNIGICGQIVVRAMRDIAAGEEVCFDYAMTDSQPYDQFDCACGTAGCRGRVTGLDWQRKELQARYDGWFSWYLQRRIDAANGRNLRPV
jgi:hypothetical protein